MYMGVKAPEIYLRNTTGKRQMRSTAPIPNTLDLLLICAESGMSIEHAVRKVSAEIGVESVEMAEELTLLAAEMSYLQDRRIAFENLNARTGLEVDPLADHGADPVRALRHAAGRGAARAEPGKPRPAHECGGEEGGRRCRRR